MIHHHGDFLLRLKCRHEIGRTASELYDLALSHELAARSLTGPARERDEIIGYLLAARTREKNRCTARQSRRAARHTTRRYVLAA